MNKKILLLGLVLVLLSSVATAKQTYYEDFEDGVADGWYNSNYPGDIFIDSGSQLNDTKSLEGRDTNALQNLAEVNFTTESDDIIVKWSWKWVTADRYISFDIGDKDSSDYVLRCNNNPAGTLTCNGAGIQTVTAGLTGVYEAKIKQSTDIVKLYFNGVLLQSMSFNTADSVTTYFRAGESNTGASPDFYLDNFEVCTYDDCSATSNTVIITAKDSFVGFNITTFNATFVNTTSSVKIQTTNGTIYYNNNYIYNITIDGINHYSRTYVDYNTSTDLEANLTQSYLNLILTNLANTTQYNDVTWHINESHSGTTTTIVGSGSVAYLNATNGTYTYRTNKSGYPSSSGSFTLGSVENKTIYASTGFYAEINLIDEVNLTAFDIGGTNGTKAIVVCSDIGSYTYDLTNETQNISIPCLYKSLRITVTYDDVTYARNLLSNETDVFSQDVYLIDLTTTQSLQNAFVINDYAGEYKDVEMYVKKNVEGAQVVIHSDFLDAENKMSVYLIENDVYLLSLESSNKPTLALGFYGADISGTKEITVTSANNDIESPEYVGTGIAANTFSTGNGTSLLANAIYNDPSSSTTSVTWTIQYLNETNNSLSTFYTVNINNSNTVTFVSQNISQFSNTTVYGIITYIHNGATSTITKIIYEPVPSLHAGTLFAWFNSDTLQWGVIIVLSIILLIGTISTQNIVNYVVLGLGALAQVFDLWVTSVLILVFGLLINLIYHLKTEDSRKVTQ